MPDMMIQVVIQLPAPSTLGCDHSTLISPIAPIHPNSCVFDIFSAIAGRRCRTLNINHSICALKAGSWWPRGLRCMIVALVSVLLTVRTGLMPHLRGGAQFPSSACLIGCPSCSDAFRHPSEQPCVFLSSRWCGIFITSSLISDCQFLSCSRGESVGVLQVRKIAAWEVREWVRMQRLWCQLFC